jgi:hypothetical protein
VSLPINEKPGHCDRADVSLSLVKQTAYLYAYLLRVDYSPQTALILWQASVHL